MTGPYRLDKSTPFPNRLIDEAMPLLTDSEWRLLCVLVRQTLGWQTANQERKEWEWLSHSQLKKRTGRASAAISRAIDGLVKGGLIEVATPTGVVLSTAKERRTSQQRMLFRLK